MTTVELQTAIDNKDWSLLNTMETWKSLHKTPAWRNVTITKEMIHDFYCKIPMNSIQFFDDSLGTKAYIDDVTNTILALYKCDLDDYSAIAKLILSDLSDYNIPFYESAVNTFSNWNYRFLPRPDGFLKILLQYKNVIAAIKSAKLTSKDLNGLDDSDFKQLKDLYESNEYPRYNWSVAFIDAVMGKDYYLKNLPTLSEDQDIYSNLKSIGTQINTALEVYTQDELMKVLKDNKDSRRLAEDYQKLVIGSDIDDKNIDEIIDISNNVRSWVSDDFIRKCSVDQFKTINNKSNYGVLLCRNAEINDWTDIADEEEQRRAAYYTMDYRFYTEEEIISNPNMFDPTYLKNAKFYISKETFKLLNKTFSRRFRYNDNLTSFDSIVNYNKRIVTQDILFYLMDKTKVSNEDFLKTVTSIRFVRNLDFIKPLTNLLKDTQ